MSASTSEQIRQLGEQAVEFTSATSEYRPRRPSAFLSLAPNTSESYPRAQRAKQPLTSETLAAATQPQNTTSDEEATKRRTSSLSSDASKFRFLKLGPVHWGEHQDDHKADFHEVAVE
ncbi:hypothetical protein C7999DRAFT_15930 [Corynascus novoguineensis]|uniref:Uncharacterized protein n=1 Tax=Corynascus novoguineensis TaxID=1126955 RepID=A0AAN7HHP1_9PEZI|nr:hypothetical protein C7999DRAFT_15930 [Corynascus novoguineensis]